MNQEFGVCNLSLVPLRAEASDKSEMLSQLLFGDYFEVLERTEKWSRIRNAYDDYEGWVDNKQYAVTTYPESQTPENSKPVLDLEILQTLINEATGELLNLVAGSTLPAFRDGRCTINEIAYSLNGSVKVPDPALFYDGVENAARFYLNTPYLWGGRSVFGIDCSGFCQMVFKQFGIRLKRDAWQQALQGTAVDFLQEAHTGDLAFFDNDEGRIIHVGIMLGNSRIIHASGRVKIEMIDTEGIYSEELKRYTHKLRIIKRFNS